LFYNENHKPLLRRKASLLFHNNYLQKAEKVLDTLLCMKDSSFVVLKQAGICKTSKWNSDAAIVLLRKAHRQSKDMEVMLHLASSLSKKPEYFEEAVEVISQIHKNVQPDSAVIYHISSLLAQAYLGVKDTVNAIIHHYYSMNQENKEDRLLRMVFLANHAHPETSHSLLWYTHYYFLQNLKSEYLGNWNYEHQKKFSKSLLDKYYKYMHVSGKKRVSWQMFDGKWKSVTMEDVLKMAKKN
jgi:tetratricopeptide (TPR) repeat protein